MALATRSGDCEHGHMELKLLQCVSDQGSDEKENEDACGITTLAAWVLDGATGLGGEPLLPGRSDAAWLVSAYNERLRASADRGGDLVPLFEGLIRDVAAAFEASRLRPSKERFELPSAGMAFVRLQDGRLEYARLGDCRVIVDPGDGTGVRSTARSQLESLDAEAIDEMRQRLREANGALEHAELLRMVTPRLRANRNLFNTGGVRGYWVLSTHPEAAGGMNTGTIPLKAGRGGAGVAKGLLVSDGFYRLVDAFHLYYDGTLLEAASRDGGLAIMLKQLRTEEEQDPECRAPLRFKQRDDATALLFEVAG